MIFLKHFLPARKILLCLLVLTVFPQFVDAADSPLSVRQQDGIVADLRVVGKQAILRWRFLRPLPSPIDSTSGKIGDISLPQPALQPFPAPGETSVLLALIDRTGKNRDAEITRLVSEYIVMIGSQPGFMNILAASYDRGVHPIIPRGLEDMVAQLAALDPVDIAPNLNDILAGGISAVSALPAQRRGVFVFSDGHSVPGLDEQKISQLASASGVAITFILSNGHRTVDRAKLDVIAARSGGQVVDQVHAASFLNNPFLLMHSGATEIFQLPDVERFFWQRAPRVDVVVKYGDKSLVLAASRPIPIAGVRRTATYLVQTHPVELAGSGAAVFALLGGLAFFVSRRRAVPPEDKVADQDTAAPASASNPVKASSAVLPLPPEPEPALVLAVLQNIGDGNAFSVRSALANIGRATTNEVVIEDPAISRVHAVMEQRGFGSFSIENRSSNGTFVNHQKIDKALLADGDLITMGATTLRYVQAAPAMTPPPQ